MAPHTGTQAARVRQANAGVLIEWRKASEKARVASLYKAASFALAKCQPGASMICHYTTLVEALTGLIAMLAPHVSQVGPGTAIKPLGASREGRGIRIWKPVSAKAAERKDGASRSNPRCQPMVEDLSEIVEVIGAHRIRMQARRVQTAGRGVPIEAPDHHKVAVRPCNRNSPPTGAMERQAGICLRRPFVPRTPRNPIEAMSHQAPTTIFRAEVESFGRAIEWPPARSKVHSSDMPARFPVGRTRGTDGI
ncbi:MULTISPECIES: hypothetical protein [Bradyrhizobium]|uniref:hypothetical protein n=1 Tax=Bradyrhizobium pachyrhizi TaxID=280333 RepID=UPI0004891988